MGEGRFIPLKSALGESDLWVGLSPEADAAGAAAALPAIIAGLRSKIEAWISGHPEFATSLEPVADDASAPRIVRAMLSASSAAGVGPMAAVAGAVAQAAGEALLERFRPREIAVENGGDLWLACAEPLVLGIYAGFSSLSGKIGLQIPADSFPLGVCTSSARVGPSRSLGNADAAVVACRDAALADAWATALGNRVRTKEDLPEAVEACAAAEGLLSCLAIRADAVAVAGGFRVLPLQGK